MEIATHGNCPTPQPTTARDASLDRNTLDQ